MVRQHPKVAGARRRAGACGARRALSGPDTLRCARPRACRWRQAGGGQAHHHRHGIAPPGAHPGAGQSRHTGFHRAPWPWKRCRRGLGHHRQRRHRHRVVASLFLSTLGVAVTPGGDPAAARPLDGCSSIGNGLAWSLANRNACAPVDVRTSTRVAPSGAHRRRLSSVGAGARGRGQGGGGEGALRHRDAAPNVEGLGLEHARSAADAQGHCGG